MWPVPRADNLTTFVSALSWNLGTWNSWKTQGLPRPLMGLLYTSTYYIFRQWEIPYGTVRYKCIQVSGGEGGSYVSTSVKMFSPGRGNLILSYGLSNSTREVSIPWQWEVFRHHEPTAYDEKNFMHYMNMRNRRIMKAEPPCDLRISTTGFWRRDFRVWSFFDLT